MRTRLPLVAASLVFSFVFLANCSSETGTSDSFDDDAESPVLTDANSGMEGLPANCDDAGNCSCPGSLVVCGDRCVDLSSNESHCGECGESCRQGGVCRSGNCRCPDGTVECDNTCADLSSSVDHCGGCDNDCPENGVCMDGSCACPSGLVDCGNRCVDLSSSFEHCGECGSDCSQGQQCSSGNCQMLSCTGGKVACSGSCVDVSSNTDHCGECGRECVDGEECQSGVCTCPSGNAVCNSVGNDGELVGGSCRRERGCADRSRCLRGGDFPDGTCTVSCEDQQDCPAGTRCVDERGGSCLLSCSQDDDCRDGYACEQVDAQGNDGEPRVCIEG